MPLTDWELWACAQHVMSRRGAQAQDFVFHRVVELAKQADEDGIATWQEIGRRIEILTAQPGSGDAVH